jgi:plastocyanin domain-containing protein
MTDGAWGKEEALSIPSGHGEVQRVEIVAGDYYFKPDRVVVRVNVPVEIYIEKEQGIVPHNIIIRAPEAGIDVEEELSSEQKVIRFTPTRVGKYPFFCDKKFLFFKGHREKGMEGILEVER